MSEVGSNVNSTVFRVQSVHRIGSSKCMYFVQFSNHISAV